MKPSICPLRNISEEGRLTSQQKIGEASNVAARELVHIGDGTIERRAWFSDA